LAAGPAVSGQSKPVRRRVSAIFGAHQGGQGQRHAVHRAVGALGGAFLGFQLFPAGLA
jgi:uncharacterized protein YcfJ